MHCFFTALPPLITYDSDDDYDDDFDAEDVHTQNVHLIFILKYCYQLALTHSLVSIHFIDCSDLIAHLKLILLVVIVLTAVDRG